MMKRTRVSVAQRVGGSRNRFGAVDFASRRGFLQAMGVGAGFAPFVPLTEAQAQPGNAPQRLVIVASSNGVGEPSKFFPSGTETNFMLGSTLASLEPYKSDLIVFRDFEGRYVREELGVHPLAAANLLTASAAVRPERGTGAERREATRATSISVDQFIAKSIGKNSAQESLILGCGAETFSAGDDLGGCVSYRAASDPIVAEADIFKTFERLFGKPAATSGSGSTQGAAANADQRSILDAVSKNLIRLRGGVGAEDVRRLDAHLESLRDLEKRLPQIGAGDAPLEGEEACTPPGLPSAGTFNTRIAARFMPEIMKAQIDMIVAAFACDLTRVALLQVGITTALWPPSFMGINGTIHDISHNNPAAMTQFTARTVQDSYAYLLGRLKTQHENGAPLLRQTAAVWTNDFTDGAIHAAPLPIIAAGQAGGKWRTGRFIQFNARRRHSDFLLTLVRTFGIELDKFGTDPGTGPITEMMA